MTSQGGKRADTSNRHVTKGYAGHFHLDKNWFRQGVISGIISSFIVLIIIALYNSFIEPIIENRHHDKCEKKGAESEQKFRELFDARELDRIALDDLKLDDLKSLATAFENLHSEKCYGHTEKLVWIYDQFDIFDFVPESERMRMLKDAADQGHLGAETYYIYKSANFYEKK